MLQVHGVEISGGLLGMLSRIHDEGIQLSLDAILPLGVDKVTVLVKDGPREGGDTNLGLVHDLEVQEHPDLSEVVLGPGCPHACPQRKGEQETGKTTNEDRKTTVVSKAQAQLSPAWAACTWDEVTSHESVEEGTYLRRHPGWRRAFRRKR